MKKLSRCLAVAVAAGALLIAPLAPANAIADLKAVAGLVMAHENGAGVAEFIHQHLLTGDGPGGDMGTAPPETCAEPGD